MSYKEEMQRYDTRQGQSLHIQLEDLRAFKKRRN